jgi:hypothetical protein
MHYKTQERCKIAAQVLLPLHKIQTHTYTKMATQQYEALPSAAVLGGWASLPELLSYEQPLFQCFLNSPAVSVACAQVFTILWEETNWE